MIFNRLAAGIVAGAIAAFALAMPLRAQQQPQACNPTQQFAMVVPGGPPIQQQINTCICAVRNKGFDKLKKSIQSYFKKQNQAGSQAETATLSQLQQMIDKINQSVPCQSGQ